jgi:hypothetical protein
MIKTGRLAPETEFPQRVGTGRPAILASLTTSLPERGARHNPLRSQLLLSGKGFVHTEFVAWRAASGISSRRKPKWAGAHDNVHAPQIRPRKNTEKNDMRHPLWFGCLFLVAGMGAANAAVTLSGTVSDTSGKALDSIRVSLQAPGSTSFARDTTGTDGVFSISSDSTTGTYVLKSTSLGSSSYTTKYDTIVLSGKDTAGLVLKMVAVAAAVKSSVSGKVDSAGSDKALSGAVVTLRSSSGSTSTKDTTAADGTYSFASVTTGIYTISVAATGYTTKSLTDTVTETPDTVNVSLVATVTSTVSGKVDSAGSGKALSGAIVTLRSSSGSTSIKDTTAADGTYSFASVTTGIYTISVAATGYTTKSLTDTVTATPDTVNVSLVVPVAAMTITISGTVSDSSGKKMDSVYVAFRSVGTSASTLLRDTTGTDGTFSMSSTYLSGTYVLRLVNLKGSKDTLSDTITLDSTNLSATIVWGKSIIVGVKKIQTNIKTNPDVYFANGILKLSNVNSAGSVRLYNAKGELMAVQSFQASPNVNLPIGRILPMGNYILRIDQKGTSMQRWIVVQ